MEKVTPLGQGVCVTQHPITNGISDYGLYSNGHINQLGSDALLLGKDYLDNPCMAVIEPGSGFAGRGGVFVITDFDPFRNLNIDEFQNRALLRNVLDWADSFPNKPELVLVNSLSVAKGRQNGGSLASLQEDDGDYLSIGAQYDPSNPEAVISAVIVCSGNALNSTYSSGQLIAVQKCTTIQAKYRVRAVRPDGSYVTIMDNVNASLTDQRYELPLPSAVSDFIDFANGNRVRAELRAASSNRFAGFFRYDLDQMVWQFTR
jgi:hypothetical protein